MVPACDSTPALLAPVPPSVSELPAAVPTLPVLPCTPPLSSSVPPSASTLPVLFTSGVTLPKPPSWPALLRLVAPKLPPAMRSSAVARLPNALLAVKVLALPMVTMPALVNAPALLKLRPLRIVNWPATVFVAKLARASAPSSHSDQPGPGPSKMMDAALVTMLAPVNSRMPGPVTA